MTHDSTSLATVTSASLGEVASHAVVWRLGGESRVSAIVKVVLQLVSGRPMALLPPEPVCLKDRHEGNNPLGPLCNAGETALRLPRAEITLQGYAYGRGASERTVELTYGNQTRTVLQKRLLVRGAPSADGGTKVFDRVALRWENAYGGLGSSSNPVGRGRNSMDKQPASVVYPGREEHPASFAPLPANFPIRRHPLAAFKRLADIAENADWSAFQAAPKDQWLDSLEPGEWVAIDGVCADGSRLSAQLPRLHGHARVYDCGNGADANSAWEVPLRADSLRLDSEARRAILLFRGDARLPDTTSGAAFLVVGAARQQGQAIPWPTQAAALALTSSHLPEAAPRSAAQRGSFEQTVGLADVRPTLPTPLPFDAAPPSAGSFVGTLELSDTALNAQSKRAASSLPFARDDAARDDGSPGAAVSQRGGVPEPVPSQPHSESIPGAPWSTDSAAAPLLPSEDFASTVGTAAVLEEEREEQRLRAAEEEQKKLELAREEAETKAAEEREKAAAQARAEAEARREREAERYRQAQIEAKARRAQDAAAEDRERDDAAQQLRKNLYGGLRRKRRK